MMKYLVIFGSLLLLFLIWRKKNEKQQPKSGDVITCDGVVKNNLLIVENVTNEQVEKAIKNIKSNDYKIDFEYELKDNCLFINYPKGVEFYPLCYIANSIQYEFEKKKVRCWCTTNNINWGGSSDIMLYMHPDTEEYDCIYIATKSGEFYKQEFHGFSLCLKEDILKIPYENCTKQL
ncbi:MAG: hypothetical protein U0L67_03780 [Paludibacteraceae bacterium]|nr:hypothetical protein [Paludibacteraceae bacterium]